MRKFHEMEMKFNLFDIGKEKSFPIWDLLRVSTFNDFVITDHVSTSSSNIWKNILLLLSSFLSIFKLLYRRRSFLFFEFAKDRDENGYYYDHISRQFIESTMSSQRVVVDVCKNRNSLLGDVNIYCVLTVCRFLIIRKHLPSSIFDQINTAFREAFSHDLSYNTLEVVYKDHLRMMMASAFIMDLVKPQKIFVSGDQQKGIYISAKRRNITTYEFQHAGLVFAYPSYSYPQGVHANSNIAFADNYLQFGKAWMINNVPSNRIVIGNDSFIPQSPLRLMEGKYIVIISNKTSSKYLMPIAKELTSKLKRVKIVYKLHPQEYLLVNKYKSFFKDCPNVDVLTTGFELPNLIAYAELILLIYSSVCYEALSMSKKVAILKKDNYEVYGGLLDGIHHVRFVDNADDIEQFYGEEIKQENICFFDPFDQEIAKNLMS